VHGDADFQPLQIVRGHQAESQRPSEQAGEQHPLQAEGVGAATTAAVVASSILILALDYVLTEAFFAR
jgi:hypothetical protein